MQFFSQAPQFNDNSCGWSLCPGSKERSLFKCRLALAPLLALTPLTPHRETKLRYATNADRNDDDRAQQRRDKERNGKRHSPARREEIDSHLRGVLGNEINERDAKDDRDDNTDPGGRDPRVAKVLLLVP